MQSTPQAHSGVLPGQVLPPISGASSSTRPASSRIVDAKNTSYDSVPDKNMTASSETAAAPPPGEATAAVTRPNAAAVTDANDTTTVNVGAATYAPIPTVNAKELKSYQVRALIRKTVSYQKRQTVSNVCCVTLCPFLMIALSALLATIISNLLASGAGNVNEFVYCSNANAMNPDTNTPLTSNLPIGSSTGIAGASGSNVRLANFLVTPVSGGTAGPPSGGRSAPCVVWLEPSYAFKDHYERDPFASIPAQLNPLFTPTNRQLARSGSIFQADPRLGWLNPAQYQIPIALVPITSAQHFPWVEIVEPEGVNLGKKERKPSFTFAQAGPGLQNMNNGDEGLLGAFQTRVFANVTSAGTGNSIDFRIENFQPVPFFTKRPGASEDTVDKELATLIRSVLEQLSTVQGKEVALQRNPETIALLRFQNNVGKIVQQVPWGVMLVRKWDTSNRKFEYVLQFGRDSRISRAASFPTEGFRKLIYNSMLSNALIKSLYPGSSIVQGLRAFPQLVSTAFTINIGTFLGRILYPFGISFLLPIFVITITREKEDKIAIMMQMYGLKLSTYYLAHWLHFFVLYLVSAVVFIVSGIVFQQQLFTATDGGVIVILFLCWGVAQISLAFFFSAFFSKSRNALVVTFLLVLMSVIVNVTMETLFTGQAPAAYLLYPAFAFYRGLILLNNAATTKGAQPYTMAMLQGNNEVLRCIVFLIWETFFYLALAYYFSQVLPSQFGVQKKWHFIFTEPWAKLSGKNKKQEEADRHNYAVVVDQDETQFEDQDVKAERTRIDENKFSSSAPLIVRHMRKIYPGTRKIAVKDVTFAAESGECFGLLGPNGAGKTSLISILTGLYEPTLGEATLGGYDIKSQRKYVYRITGICPQHDILWDDLTVGEHLLFYIRLKGIPPEQEEEAKNQALAAVSLQNFEDRLSKGLSGGEKRRLSIAIALSGDPKVVFFDEPTTGLDPEVRRVIWNILSAARKGRTVVLTTHSMEEAETLCTRIGIMAKGTLRCIGSQIRLKKLYGAGFKITYIAQPENMAHATEKIKEALPANAKIVDSFAMATTVEFMPAEGALNAVFESLQQHSKEWLIDDWGISQTSLEEVFLRLISETDAEGSAE